MSAKCQKQTWHYKQKDRLAAVSPGQKRHTQQTAHTEMTASRRSLRLLIGIGILAPSRLNTVVSLRPAANRPTWPGPQRDIRISSPATYSLIRAQDCGEGPLWRLTAHPPWAARQAFESSSISFVPGRWCCWYRSHRCCCHH